MPYQEVNGTRLYYEIHGSGKETIVFSHGLLWSGKMFAKQVESFKNRYRCVVYDHRGQGRSDVPEKGYDMETIYEDALGLIRVLALSPCHFAGLSMGGFVAMRLAIRNPELLKSVILMETSADAEPFKFKYTLLNTIVKLFGVKTITHKVMPIMFGQTFLNDPVRMEEVAFWRDELNANKKTIVRAVEGVIHRNTVFDDLKLITLPTLIMVGSEDVATVPEKAERIKTQIEQAQLVTIQNAGHSSSVEEPEQVNTAMNNFIATLS